MTDMIILTKLNGQKFALNNRLIETIQENPDTTVKPFHILYINDSILERDV